MQNVFDPYKKITETGLNMQNKEFGRRLNEGIYSVAKNQGKDIGTVLDDIGVEVGYRES